MSIGPSAALANAWLDALGNNTAGILPIATPYVKLHVGDPGSAGTANAATETTRKLASFAAASGGSMASDADISWTSISGSEDATHFSLWTASSGGTFLGSGTITAAAYTAGGTYTCPSGSLILSLTIAA
jgi:hypothetical protein